MENITDWNPLTQASKHFENTESASFTKLENIRD
jgi:hypothetical protein